MYPLDTAMILAAGRGQRMRPLTDDCPKPLLALAGKALIIWHLENLATAGFKRVVINLAYLGDKIAERLGDGSEWGLKIIYSRETLALETAGGIIQALPLINRSRFAVINGDIWHSADYTMLHSAPSHCHAHLYLVDNPLHNPQGDFLLVDGMVEDSPQHTFSGIGVYSVDLLLDLPQGRRALAPVLRQAMKQGMVSGEHLLAQWVDVGTPQRLMALEKQILEMK